jgi:hypothetical protein
MTNTPDTTPRRLPRRLAIAAAITLAAVLLLYTLGGFVLLPWYTKRELPRLVEQQLQRQAQIGEIAFNPFTLTLTATNFALKEKDGRPLIAFKHALIDLEWRSLTQRAIVFGVIRLDAPALQVEMSPEGRLNLAALAGEQTAAPATAAAPPPRFIIGDLQIDGGVIAFEDQRSGYKNRFEELSFKLSSLSTLRDDKGPYALSARTPGGAALKWKGELSITPLVATGTILLEHGALPELQPFVKDFVKASITDGRASLELPYQFALPDGKPQLAVKGGKLAVENFALTASAADTPSLALTSLTVDDLALDLSALAAGQSRIEVRNGRLAATAFKLGAAGSTTPSIALAALALDDLALNVGARTVSIAAIRLDAPGIRAQRSENGEIDLVKLLMPRKTDKPSAPWQVSVAKVELAGGALAFDDRALGLAPALKDIAVKLSDVTGDFSKPVPFDVTAAIVSGGTLTARGRAAPGGAVEAEVGGAAIALAPLQPLLARYLNGTLTSGEAAFAGKLKTGQKDAALVYAGSAGVNNLQLNDPTGVLLAGWKSLATTTLRAQVAPTQIEIDTLRWQEPAGKFAIAADQTSNFRRALKRVDDKPAETAAPAGAASTGDAAPAAAAENNEPGAFAIQIRRIDIRQGALDFADDNVAGGFATSIREFNGTINGISSDRSTRSQLALEGRVDEFGFARVSGSLNPFQPRDRSNVRVEFRNLDVAKVTPYAVRFAGYKIASGRLSLDLNYRVRNNLIEGDNQIVLDQFTLGEKVATPGALDLPLGLAIAILKDDNGRIDLALPISGNLDDPKFDYSAIIGKAIGNIITSIVAAPFKLLARLFSGGQNDEISQIAFDAGSARLLPPEREKIARILQALGKRPELKLQVPARYDVGLDARALRRAELRRELGKRANLDLQDEDPPGPLNFEDQRIRTAVRELFVVRFSSAELDKLRAEAEAKAKSAGAANAGDAGKQASLGIGDRLRRFTSGEPQVADTGEFYRVLGSRLLAAQPLAADALNELARKRATAIAEAFKAAGIDAARVAVTTGDPLDKPDAKLVTLELALTAR